jgi:uncharacterized phosphosugar-binding protein
LPFPVIPLPVKRKRPPVWTSANIKGGDEANREYVEKYLPRIHHLYPMF